MLLSLLGWIGSHAGPLLAFAGGIFAVLKPGLIIRLVMHVRDTYRNASMARREQRLTQATNDMLGRLDTEVKSYSGALDRVRGRLQSAEDKVLELERREARCRAEVVGLQETVADLQAEKRAILARVESVESLCLNCPNRGSVIDGSE